MKLLNKKGDIAWEYVAAIVICLAILIVVILFADFLKDKVKELVMSIGGIFGL